MSKVAVITGSTGGVGCALVKNYVESGYLILGLDRASSKFFDQANNTLQHSITDP